MNAYYSNLIEGHNTRPADIAAALDGRADEAENRPLAEAAAAHVRVQEWIDTEFDAGQHGAPWSTLFTGKSIAASIRASWPQTSCRIANGRA